MQHRALHSFNTRNSSGSSQIDDLSPDPTSPPPTHSSGSPPSHDAWPSHCNPEPDPDLQFLQHQTQQQIEQQVHITIDNISSSPPSSSTYAEAYPSSITPLSSWATSTSAPSSVASLFEHHTPTPFDGSSPSYLFSRAAIMAERIRAQLPEAGVKSAILVVVGFVCLVVVWYNLYFVLLIGFVLSLLLCMLLQPEEDNTRFA